MCDSDESPPDLGPPQNQMRKWVSDDEDDGRPVLDSYAITGSSNPSTSHLTRSSTRPRNPPKRYQNYVQKPNDWRNSACEDNQAMPELKPIQTSCEQENNLECAVQPCSSSDDDYMRDLPFLSPVKIFQDLSISDGEELHDEWNEKSESDSSSECEESSDMESSSSATSSTVELTPIDEINTEKVDKYKFLDRIREGNDSKATQKAFAIYKNMAQPDGNTRSVRLPLLHRNLSYVAGYRNQKVPNFHYLEEVPPRMLPKKKNSVWIKTFSEKCANLDNLIDTQKMKSALQDELGSRVENAPSFSLRALGEYKQSKNLDALLLDARYRHLKNAERPAIRPTCSQLALQREWYHPTHISTLSFPHMRCPNGCTMMEGVVTVQLYAGCSATTKTYIGQRSTELWSSYDGQMSVPLNITKVVKQRFALDALFGLVTIDYHCHWDSFVGKELRTSVGLESPSEKFVAPIRIAADVNTYNGSSYFNGQLFFVAESKYSADFMDERAKSTFFDVFLKRAEAQKPTFVLDCEVINAPLFPHRKRPDQFSEQQEYLRAKKMPALMVYPLASSDDVDKYNFTRAMLELASNESCRSWRNSYAVDVIRNSFGLNPKAIRYRVFIKDYINHTDFMDFLESNDPGACVICRKKFPNFFALMMHYHCCYPRLAFVVSFSRNMSRPDEDESDEPVPLVEVIADPYFRDIIEIPTTGHILPRPPVWLVTKCQTRAIKKCFRMDVSVFCDLLADQFHCRMYAAGCGVFKNAVNDVVPEPSSSGDFAIAYDPRGVRFLCQHTINNISDFVDVTPVCKKFMIDINVLNHMFGPRKCAELGAYMLAVSLQRPYLHVSGFFQKFFATTQRSYILEMGKEYLDCFTTFLEDLMDSNTTSIKMDYQILDIRIRVQDENYDPFKCMIYAVPLLAKQQILLGRSRYRKALLKYGPTDVRLGGFHYSYKSDTPISIDYIRSVMYSTPSIFPPNHALLQIIADPIEVVGKCGPIPDQLFHCNHMEQFFD